MDPSARARKPPPPPIHEGLRNPAKRKSPENPSTPTQSSGHTPTGTRKSPRFAGLHQPDVSELVNGAAGRAGEFDSRKSVKETKRSSPNKPLKTPGSQLSDALVDLGLVTPRRTTGDHRPIEDDDVFDLMESGFSPSTHNSIAPAPAHAGMRQCFVERVKKGRSACIFNLHDQHSEAYLMSAENVGPDTFFSIYRDSNRWCGVLKVDTATDEYKLYNSGCEGCDAQGLAGCGKKGDRQVLGVFTHGKMQSMGLMCLDALLPAVFDNSSRVVWCPRTKALHQKEKRTRCARAGDGMTLSCRKPRWNSQTSAYTLDFGGRVKLSSARNIQVCLGDELLLQFGQVDDKRFSLDFKSPLGPLQAFAICISTQFWE